MKNKPIESASEPRYSDKYAHESKQDLIERMPQRWRCMPLAAGLLSITVALGLNGCNNERLENFHDVPEVEVVNIENPTSPTPSLPPTPEPPQVMKAGFITQSMTNPAQMFSWVEFQRLMGDYGFEMVQYSGNNEVEVEIAGIEKCIAEGYDAIFVNPSDIDAIIPYLRVAKEAGLIVGMFSSELPDDAKDAADFFCGSDDFLGSMLAGQFVSQKFPDGANFVEVGGKDGHATQISRRDGFRAGIADNIIELESQNCPTGWEHHEVLAIMKNFIIKHGEKIDIVWCHWDNGASAVIEALQAANINDVFVIGVDGNYKGYQQVMDGTQSLSVGYSWTNMVAKTLENAKIMMEGGSVEYHNDIPMDMITLDDIDPYLWPGW